MLKRFVWITVFIANCAVAFAQNLPVRSDVLEDFYRRAQLTGILDPRVSFAVRPFTPSLVLSADSLDNYVGFLTPKQAQSIKFDSLHYTILPVSITQQYSGSPLNHWNDGAMIKAKGYQSMVSAGIFAKYGPLSVQINPEYVFAANDQFTGRPTSFGNADIPIRFTDQPFSRFYWGQSSVRLNFSPLSIGISNENLWWGPGNRNSLLMSNNAPGFKHLTLNTTKPIKTPIGSIEGQIIAGRLDGSGTSQTLPKDWRYLSGLVFSYNPRWTSGLFLGLTRSFQMYNNNMDGSFGDLFPFFQAFQKKNTSEDNTPRDQLTSVFARWMVPASKAEIYFEYGLNDHSHNIRDFLMSPDHSRAYILGIRKLIPYGRRAEEFIQVAAEITHLEQSVDALVRDAGSWYTHHEVLHGYTHRGQILGAGIGPSANHQSLELSWVNNLRRIGIQLERYEHNGDVARVLDYSPWIDISMAANGSWTYKRLLLNTKIQAINSINYQWNDGFNGRAKQNKVFFNGQVGLMYTFNKKWNGR